MAVFFFPCLESVSFRGVGGGGEKSCDPIFIMLRRAAHMAVPRIRGQPAVERTRGLDSREGARRVVVLMRERTGITSKGTHGELMGNKGTAVDQENAIRWRERCSNHGNGGPSPRIIGSQEWNTVPNIKCKYLLVAIH